MPKNKFSEQVEDINKRADSMMAICVASQFDPETGVMLSDEERITRIPGFVADHPMFESVSDEHKRFIVSAAQTSIREYEEVHGEFPRQDVLASAHKAMENMLLLEGREQKGSIGQMMLESISQGISNNSSNIEVRARTVGVVLPVLLSTATLDAVTMIPGQYNEVEIFKIRRIAANSFGDFEAGQEMDQLSVGQYSSMRQRYPFAAAQQPDGTKTEYTFTTKTDLTNTAVDIPFNKGSVSVFVNHKRVCRDLDSSSTTSLMSGSVKVGEADVILNCRIDYTKGIVVVTAGSALPNLFSLDIEFEVDIEKKPELIPKIEYDTIPVKIRPYQRAIAADASIQTMFKMQREYNIDIKNMQQSHLRNCIAGEKAQGHLRDMNYACMREAEFNIYVASDDNWRLHRQRIQEKLLWISAQILESTKVVGMTGMYAGRDASTVLKTLGAPDFVPAPNYRQDNNIHYAGKLFGVWKVFEAPIVIDSWDILCYGRGSSYNEAGYVAGDAIPATLYDHPILENLKSANTMYELTYGEIHPFNGEDFFYRLRLRDEAPAAVFSDDQKEAA